MNTNRAIITVAVLAIIVVLVGTYLASDRGGGDDPQEPSIEGDWEAVMVYTGGWLNGNPVYRGYDDVDMTAEISHFRNDFYTFEMDDERLYCSWDGEKLVTGGIHGSTSLVFIMLTPGNGNYMLVSYFADDQAVIEVYKRAGYVGEFPDLSIPLDLPRMETFMKTFKVREYTPEGPVDHIPNSMIFESVSGRMIFYDMTYSADGVYNYTGLYITSGIFMSMVTTDDGPKYEMTEYRDGVFYCSMMDYVSGNIWVGEFGYVDHADYPDVDLTGSIYYGTEDALLYKDGRITELKIGNAMGLRVLSQDDECLQIITLDVSMSEYAFWTAIITDMRPVFHYGIMVESDIYYDGVTYHGCYFGHFNDKSCSELYICGVLSSEDGSYVVISQKYVTDETGQLRLT